MIDRNRCIGCHACSVACKAEHEVPVGENRTRVKYVETGDFPQNERLFTVLRCNHCADSPCTDICPVSALRERDDGIVDFDPERCTGCKSCIQACPYEAPYINPDTGTSEKCNFCSHRVDSGRKPACDVVCPEDAIRTGDLDDPSSEISQVADEAEVRKPEKGTEPNLFYVGGEESTGLKRSSEDDHYMWSQAKKAPAPPGEEETDRAAERLAESDVDLPGDGEEDREASARDLLEEEAEVVYDAPVDRDIGWNWEVYGYMWTKAIASGALLVPALLMLAGVIGRDPGVWGISSLAALVFTGISGPLLILDLERLDRFHWVLLRPNWSSWLAKGAWLLSGFALLTLLLTAGWLVAPALATSTPVLAISGLYAAAASTYSALLFRQAKGRDLWRTPLTPVHLLVMSLVAGSGLLAVVGTVSGKAGLAITMKPVLIGSLALHAAIAGFEVYSHRGDGEAGLAVEKMLTDMRPSFWGGATLAGAMLPLAMLLIGAGAAVTAGAGALAVAGLLFYEYCWITAPQRIPLT